MVKLLNCFIRKYASFQHVPELRQGSDFKFALKFGLFVTHGDIISLWSSAADEQTGNKRLALISVSR